MKKLYALLLILIVAYVGINVICNNVSIYPNHDVDDSEAVNLGDYKFPELKSFTAKKINDTAIQLFDSNKNMSVKVSEIDNSKNITKIVSDAYSSKYGYTSNQTFSQNGVNVYLLYKEGAENYNSNIYFSKNNHNYMITGSNIKYEDSDYFIDSSKQIIDTINPSDGKGGGFSRW